MNCLANIICCGSAILAVGIAGVATLCSNRMMDGRNNRIRNCFKAAAGAIARATGNNYIKLRVYSNPNFRSKGWDSDSASDEDDDDENDDEHITVSHDEGPSTSSEAVKGWLIHTSKKSRLS